MITQPLRVEVLPEGIILFVMQDFTRKTIDEWAAYVEAHDGKLKSPMRSLYDMRAAGYPTPYLLSTVVTLMNRLQIPEDTRTGYLASDTIQQALYQVMAARMPKRVGKVRVFMNGQAAIDWLLG